MTPAPVASEPILRVDSLRVGFDTRKGYVEPVRGVSFGLAAGERLAIVGESGSGKSLTALAVMRLVRPAAAIRGGAVWFDGRELLGLPAGEMARVRGGGLAMVYQNPMSALNPVRSIGNQLTEAIRLHEDVSRKAANARAVELLGQVGMPAPARRFHSYPHEFSGGMRQRVMIAMALSCRPSVLIADEPTTALDVTTQARILKLLDSLVNDLGSSVLFITHDLGVAAEFCNRIQVMYAGQIVESGDVAPVYASPAHPYTEALLESTCTIDIDIAAPIKAIPGLPPLPDSFPGGCPFHVRCPYAQPICTEADPPARVVAPDREARCHFAEERLSRGAEPAGRLS